MFFFLVFENLLTRLLSFTLLFDANKSALVVHLFFLLGYAVVSPGSMLQLMAAV